jgi:hypothetical protein
MFTVTAIHSPKTPYVQRPVFQNALPHAMEKATMEMAILVRNVALKTHSLISLVINSADPYIWS